MHARPLARALRALAPAAALLVSCLSALADGTDFTRLAPPKPMMMLSVPDFAKLQQSFNASELGKLWEEPGVQALVQEMSEETFKRLGEFLKDLGTDINEIKPPTGTVGIAMYLREDAPKDDSKQDKLDPEGFFAADAGENAQAWKDLIEKLIERGVKDKELTTEEDTYSGTTVTTLKPMYAEPEKKQPDDAGKRDEGEEEPPTPPQKGFAGFIGGSKDYPEAMYVAWAGATLLVSSHLKTLEHGLDAAAGKDVESLAGDAGFKSSLAQHPEGMQAIALLDLHQILMESMRDAARSRERITKRPVEPAPDKLIEALGLGELGATTFGLRLDSADALVDVSIGTLVPEKKGVFALIADAPGSFDPPGFVPPDASGITRFSFRFDKLYDFLRTLPAALPEEDRARLTSTLDQGVNMVKPALDAAGPNVYLVQTLRQPLAADSSMMVAAIEVKDATTVANTLSFFAGTLKGLVEPREFEGNTIYTSEMMGLSAGLGFGQFFVGHTPAVENVMRLAGRTDAPRIGSEPAFKEATRTFGSEGVLHSYTDIAQAVKWSYWGLQNADKAYEAQLEEIGITGEQRDEIMKRYREGIPKWMGKLPPVETILAHIGNTSSELRSTPEGFRGRLLLLKPDRK